MKFEEILPEIRNGRRFRHIEWIDGFYDGLNCTRGIRPTLTELLSDCWILEPLPEKKVEVTKQTLVAAWKEASYKAPEGAMTSFQLERLMKELGLV